VVVGLLFLGWGDAWAEKLGLNPDAAVDLILVL
jgi:hypothetical protein